MTTDRGALLDEAEWLLDGGVHPATVAQQLGVTATSIEVSARRAGRPDLAARFYAEAAYERTHKRQSVAA